MKKNRFKPLKAVGLTLVVLVILVFGLAWVYGHSFSPKKPAGSIAQSIERATASAIDLDTDQDGIKDWEEIIFRTDPKNADSDGDGTQDGEEIAKNRNPLKKGPGDANPVALEQADYVSDAYGRLKELSSQGNITQAFVSQIISQNGIDSFLNPENSKETADSLEAYLQKIKSQPKFSADAIPDTALVIANDTSDAAIKTYFGSVAKIYETNIFPLKTDDLTILQEALNKNDASELSKISPLIAAIEKTYQEIKTVPVPKNILLFHKKELFLLKSAVQELSLVQSASLEDAFYLALLMGMRLESKKRGNELHNSEIPLWLESKKIIFSAGDAARMLYQKR